MSDEDTVRLTVRVDRATHERMRFWAEKSGAGSVNAWLIEAALEKISRHNGHIPDAGNLVLNRLGQLIDLNKSMQIRLDNVEAIFNEGIDSLLTLARGDNFLMDEIDGDLDG